VSTTRALTGDLDVDVESEPTLEAGGLLGRGGAPDELEPRTRVWVRPVPVTRWASARRASGTLAVTRRVAFIWP
jgi:hypothetical protein